MFDKEDYKQLIVDSLFKKGLIDKGIYEKCSKPKYIQSLPHDLRTDDTAKLTERKNKINENIKENNILINNLNNQRKEFEKIVDEDIENVTDNYEKSLNRIFGSEGDDDENIDNTYLEWVNKGFKEEYDEMAKNLAHLDGISSLKKDLENYKNKGDNALADFLIDAVVYAEDLDKVIFKVDKIENDNGNRYHDNLVNTATLPVRRLRNYLRELDDNFFTYQNVMSEIEYLNNMNDDFKIELDKINGKLE